MFQTATFPAAVTPSESTENTISLLLSFERVLLLSTASPPRYRGFLSSHLVV